MSEPSPPAPTAAPTDPAPRNGELRNSELRASLARVTNEVANAAEALMAACHVTAGDCPLSAIRQDPRYRRLRSALDQLTALERAVCPEEFTGHFTKRAGGNGHAATNQPTPGPGPRAADST